MSSLPSRPRIIGENAHKYISRNVTVVGTVNSINSHANSFILVLPDDENLVVLLNHNTTTIEPNLLTEVTGKLVSRGQIEATNVKQYDPKWSAKFDKKLYVDSARVFEACRMEYDI